MQPRTLLQQRPGALQAQLAQRPHHSLVLRGKRFIQACARAARAARDGGSVQFMSVSMQFHETQRRGTAAGVQAFGPVGQVHDGALATQIAQRQQRQRARGLQQAGVFLGNHPAALPQ